MNQKLKFAFATVITLIAVLWICYCVFCGFIYLKGGELGESVMMWAGILTVLVFLLLTGSFLGAQFIKATDHKFKKFIVWERIFMFGVCPAVFLFAGYFYSHFFTIHSKSEEAEKSFVLAVEKARNIFPEYRNYAETRIDEYANNITTTGYRKVNKVHVLTTRLLPSTLNQMEEQCTNWIKDVDKNVTVWNPFLLGNIPFIQKGIKDWHKKLYEFSEFRMKDERNVSYFDENETYIQDALDNLKNTQQIYSQWKFPNFWAILTGILCYALLVFVYIIQERNTKNLHTLFSNPHKRNEEEFGERKMKKNVKGNNNHPYVGDF